MTYWHTYPDSKPALGERVILAMRAIEQPGWDLLIATYTGIESRPFVQNGWIYDGCDYWAEIDPPSDD